MASAPLSFFSVLFTVFALSICFCEASAAVLKNNDLIHETCKITDNYKLCVSLLESYPHTELKSNLTGILNIFIRITINEASSNLWYLQELLKRAKDKASKECLRTCKDSYWSSITYLQESITNLRSKTYWALRMDLSKAQLSGRMCQSSDTSPSSSFCKLKMKGRNDYFDQLFHFSFKVVDLIDPHHQPPSV